MTLNLTGEATSSTLTNASGNYAFAGLASGGSYTVTPTKAHLLAGTGSITTADVLATARHFLNITPLPAGCRSMAADANGDSLITTVDVVAIQRFYLGLATGTANVGKYGFLPASRSYPLAAASQTEQNYDTLIYGDVAAPFASRAGEPSEDAVSNAEIPVTVALPDVGTTQSRMNFVAEVSTSVISVTRNLVGFQGDLTFDERVVTFQSEPVRKAGLTAGNWNVSGNVLEGTGPIRTLRISAYSNDFKPLSGSGVLFELRMGRGNGGQGTPLIWSAPPNGFIFIDADLMTQMPRVAVPGSVTASGNSK